MRVIINADDLGYNIDINNAIFILMERRLITSATLMSNGLACEDAINRIPRYPWCSFGIHLNLTEFQPLTRNKAFKSITGPDGNFKGNIRKVHISYDLVQAIYKEWCAQIEKMMSSGLVISHIDSHHHVHTMWQLFLVLKKVQKQFNIPKVRLSRNIYPPSPSISCNLLIKKWLWNLSLRSYSATKTTDGFTNFACFLDNLKIKEISYKTVELMVHPGWNNYAKEIAYIESPWIATIPINVSLINYNDL